MNNKGMPSMYILHHFSSVVLCVKIQNEAQNEAYIHIYDGFIESQTQPEHGHGHSLAFKFYLRMSVMLLVTQYRMPFCKSAGASTSVV